MAVENGLSFNQMASSEFIMLGFRNLGMKAIKSRSHLSEAVIKYIFRLQKKTKKKLKADFDAGKRFSLVMDEWTSIRNHHVLNICIVTDVDLINVGLARNHGSMTAKCTAELAEVC